MTKQKRKYTPRQPFARNCNQCGTEYLTSSYNSRFCTKRCMEKARYIRDRDERIQLQRDYRISNSEEIRARRKANYAANLLKFRQQSRLNYQKYREVRIADALEYQRNNPDVVALTRSRRRAQKKFKITRSDHRKLIHFYRNRCAYCEVPLSAWGRKFGNSLQWDHIIPLSKGGTDSIGNLLPVCRDCNISKSASFLMEWRLRKYVNAV